jgi:uncharacterized protein (DUF427 family)
VCCLQPAEPSALRYTRVDILPSSRHVRIEIYGVTVAESTSPRPQLETGLPVRYDLPKTHDRMDLLTPRDTVSQCPRQGDGRALVGARPRRPA